jgi:hypothetical protein
MSKTNLHKVLAIAAIAVFAAGEATHAGSSAWSTRRTEYYELKYGEGFAKDMELVDGYLQHTIRAMREYFGNRFPGKELREAQVTVYLHPAPNSKAREGYALTESGSKGGRYYADIHFLSPSRHRSGARTVAREPMDHNYVFKNVVHEYGSVVLELAARRKEKGWLWYSAPSWFVQGYQEYLALMHSSEHSRTVTFSKYLDKVRKDPQGISFASGIRVKDIYVDGAVLVAFMHDAFGKERVQNLVLSPESTFGKALTPALGVGLASFAMRFREWQRRRTDSELPKPKHPSEKKVRNDGTRDFSRHVGNTVAGIEQVKVVQSVIWIGKIPKGRSLCGLLNAFFACRSL